MFLKLVTLVLIAVIGVLILSATSSNRHGSYQTQPGTAPVSGPAVPPVWQDEFDGTQVDTSKWSVYDGSGNADNGTRSPSHATEANGVLTLSCTTDAVCAGMQSTHAQKYGTFAVRIKMSTGGDNVHPILLLWPSDGLFPAHGEVDYMEASYPTRQAADGFLHHGPYNEQVRSKVNIDLTQWHVFSVTWTPSSIAYYVDGQQWFQDTNVDHLPPTPMTPTIQIDDAGGPITNGGTMTLDWIRIYNH